MRAIGKHLLVDFSGGLTLRVHLRMTGSWHLYRPGERWRRSERSASVVLRTKEWIAVCFAAPDVAVTRQGREATSHLGPDLCDPSPDLDEILQRLTTVDPVSTIGEVVMNQHYASGIGNVYKSETLHAEHLDPRTPLASLSDERRRAVFERAHRLLVANLDLPGPRTTVPEGYAVYRRAGEPCRRCGTAIVRIMQGTELPRSTYYCPGCQVRP